MKFALERERNDHYNDCIRNYCKWCDSIKSEEYLTHMISCQQKFQNYPACVLTRSQKKAIEFVKNQSSKHFEASQRSLLKSAEKAVIDSILERIRYEVDIIVHFSFEKIVDKLLQDKSYKSLFEIDSKDTTGLLVRKTAEDKIFGNSYQNVPAVERPKYGCLNIFGNPRGVKTAYYYGTSFLILRNVKWRSTWSNTDTFSVNVATTAFDNNPLVLSKFERNDLVSLISYAETGKFLNTDDSDYREVQIHGDIQLERDVDWVVVDFSIKSNPVLMEKLRQFILLFKVAVKFTDGTLFSK